MIQRFLDGQRSLTLTTVDRIAAALGLRLVEVAGRGRGRPAKVSPQSRAPRKDDAETA